MAQSWSEFLSGLLQSSARVDKAAVFNSVGQPLAATEGLQVSEKDGRALLYCLRDPAHTITRITVDDTDYRCFQGNGNALVGVATNDAGRVLVARVTGEEGAMVVVMGTATSKGSFLFEVQQSLVERTRRQTAPRRQSATGEPRRQSATGEPRRQSATGESRRQSATGEPSPQQAAPQPMKISPPPSSPVAQEQVLVQIHD